MRLIYTESGEAIPDAQLREVAARLTRELPDEFKFSTSILIDYIRLEVLEGRLNRSDVTFELGENHLNVELSESGHIDASWNNEVYNGDIFTELFIASNGRVNNHGD